MTDLEITRLCAEAMGYVLDESAKPMGAGIVVHLGQFSSLEYDPLHDDAQAMALVKKLELGLGRGFKDGGESVIWYASNDFDLTATVWDRNLNHAICECVARMQKGKP